MSGFHSKFAPTHYPPDLSLEPTHRDIRLTVDPKSRSAFGTVSTTVRANRAGVTTIVLDAIDFQDVNVTCDEPLEFSYDGKKLSIHWNEPFDDGEERTVTVAYRVVEPITGMFFSSPSKLYPVAGTWAATDHETERARYWLPCIDHPNVRTTLHFELTSDKSFTILANGKQTSESVDGDLKTVVWDLDFPCPSYLCCFALGDFTTFEDGDFESLPVAYFCSKEHPADRLERSFGRTKDMLAWMTEKLGVPFPFPKYYQFALPGIGGAMENISLVSWDDMFILDETYAQEWTWLCDQVNVHEMAHSYFGDAVVCRDFAHVWLKESWATYMEQCWLEDRHGADERDYDWYRNAFWYFDEADTSYKRPMVTRTFDSSWDMFDRHLYPGGACRLHMLRREVGDDVFWRGVNLYLSENLGQVVETSDFRRALERASGRSLVAFFEQWFHTAGYPDLEVAFEFDASKKEGTFTVTQKQVGDDPKNEGPTFELNLEFGWTIDGETYSQNGELKAAKNTFTFPMEKDPQRVRIDPNNSVLFKLDFNPGAEKLRAQLTDAPDIVGRILAAHELSKLGGKKNVEALADAYRNESFWGVRQQIAKAISKVPSQLAVEELAKIVAEENDPMVLESLFMSCQNMKDERIADATQTRIKDGMPYRATRAAWDVIGRNSEEATDEMKAAAKEACLHAITQHGAMLGIAGTRNVADLGTLREVASGSFSSRARQYACQTMGQLAKYSEGADRERASEFLASVLRDPDAAVAWFAAGALVTMRAANKVGAIEQFYSRIPKQDQVSLARRVKGLLDPEKSVTKELAGQVDELRKTIRKLEDRLEKLE